MFSLATRVPRSAAARRWSARGLRQGLALNPACAGGRVHAAGAVGRQGHKCAQSLRSNRASSLRRSSCSQILTTFQPRARSARLTRRSRALLPAVLSRQNLALVLGRVACRGQPCQKQPSTNTAVLSFGKTKSGLPGRLEPRRQPVMPFARKTWISRSSVSLLPEPRMRDITSERFRLVKMSDLEVPFYSDFAW